MTSFYLQAHRAIPWCGEGNREDEGERGRVREGSLESVITTVILSDEGLTLTTPHIYIYLFIYGLSVSKVIDVSF